MARDIAQEIIDAVKSKAPDYTVTKLLEERTAKKKALGSADSTPSNDTILSYARSLLGGGSKDSGNQQDRYQVSEKQSSDVTVDTPFDNGTIQVAGYDPTAYGTSGTASGNQSLGNILGYVVIGLVGVALLDRIMSRKGD